MVAEPIRVDVGRIEEFGAGAFKLVQVGKREIGVIRLRNGEFRAMLNWCPHKGAPICKGIVGGTWPPCGTGEMTYDREGEVLACPWHGFEYDLDTGRELYWQHPTRLRMYPTEVVEGSVVVTLPPPRRED